jgi:hypothetical protein
MSIMAMQPPIKTTLDDINALGAYLRNKVGWSDTDDVKKRIPPKHADNRKIEAMRYIGLLERDGSNIKLSDAGRKYASATDDTVKATIMRERLREIPLYDATLEWIFHNSLEIATKTDIANHWHDNLSEESAQITGAALTDAAVFFGRIVGAAGLGAQGTHPEGQERWHTHPRPTRLPERPQDHRRPRNTHRRDRPRPCAARPVGVHRLGDRRVHPGHARGRPRRPRAAHPPHPQPPGETDLTLAARCDARQPLLHRDRPLRGR